jgi:hypothetical protein
MIPQVLQQIDTFDPRFANLGTVPGEEAISLIADDDLPNISLIDPRSQPSGSSGLDDQSQIRPQQQFQAGMLVIGSTVIALMLVLVHELIFPIPPTGTLIDKVLTGFIAFTTFVLGRMMPES